ncbi:MAG: UDP-N-acetylglucosamine--N-acetylmuramyl-(pentapeptide) pyrophosphoryl-undecaprenol N-acetylglucosamine transferase [Chlamydiales bacterium]|nr:UDP-N-acetylglucosamine--N-acetylmuramyl-(pentapeptide) pyrophosphoryl-undecaprenol N-acetylglucosamine transferase [Chlamydiales bacterium]
MRKRRIILSAGGTGGHLFPAQAVAEVLCEHELLFVAGGLSENRFFDPSRFNFEEIQTATFSASKPIEMLRGGRRILKGMRQSRKILRAFAPDVVVGFGSFYTLPLLLAAKQRKVPIILHEQNAVPGKVNRLFSRFAHTTALTFPVQIRGATRLVHFPLRRRQQAHDPWSYFGLEKGRPTLLVFGGSQGALRLNALFLEALPHLSRFQVLHFTGRHQGGIEEHYKGLPHCVKTFEPHLLEAMRIADLAICRAGASTIAELTETETPALLIPFPYATDNHQEINARHFAGGEVLLERELTGLKLAEAINTFPIERKKKEIAEFKQKRNLLHLSDVIQDVLGGISPLQK